MKIDVYVLVSGVYTPAFVGNNWGILCAPGALVYEFNLAFNNMDFWAACEPGADVNKLKIKTILTDIDDSTLTQYFFIESRKEVVRTPGVSFQISGRSSHAILSNRYCMSVTDIEATEPTEASPPVMGTHHIWQDRNTTAYDIMDNVLYNYAPAIPAVLNFSNYIDWQVADYEVFRGAFEANNSYPLDVLKRLAKVGGYEIIPLKNGQLRVQKYKVIAPAITITYDDLQHIYQLSTETDPATGINAVLVMGDNDIIEEENPVPGEPPIPTSASNPYMSVVRKPGESGSTTINIAHTIRVYYSHPENAEILYQIAESDVTWSDGGSGTESIINEPVSLRWGYGNTSKPDLNGISLVYVAADKDKASSSTSVNYDINYRDFEFSSTVEQTVNIDFYFDGEQNISSYSYDVVSEGEMLDEFDNETDCVAGGGEWNFETEACVIPASNYTDETSCTDAGNFWYDGACHIQLAPVAQLLTFTNKDSGELLVGAAITIDDIYVGVSDAFGRFTTVPQIIGSSHTIKFTHADIDDSDTDDLSNDSYIAEATP